MEKTYLNVSENANETSTSPTSVYDETSAAVANITSMLEKPKTPEPIYIEKASAIQPTTTYQSMDIISSDDDLKKSAGEILNGVKRTVQVQAAYPSTHFNFQDTSLLGKFHFTANGYSLQHPPIWTFHLILF